MNILSSINIENPKKKSKLILSDNLGPEISSSSAETSLDQVMREGPSQNKEPKDDGPRGAALASLSCMTVEQPGCPPVKVSSHHTVLVRLPHTPGLPPEPHPRVYTDVWHSQCVKMPCSPQNLYCTAPKSDVVPRWNVITEALSKPITSISELQEAILSYNTRYRGKWKFHGLYALVNQFDECEEQELFGTTLPKMCRLALRLPELITAPVPLLSQNSQASLTLSQLQIACLLANAFFCTFPRRNARGSNSEYANYPDINFNRLLSKKEPLVLEKLKCILNYFRRVTSNEPTGLVTLCRTQAPDSDMHRWQSCSSPLPRLHCHHDTLIEDVPGLLHVDFANKFLGGGVLGFGCVQEEIKFLLCPELLVSRLVTEALDKNEALVIIGVEQFNKGAGYGSSFTFSGSFHDSTQRDSFGRRLTQLVAIDALHFRQRPREQYEKPLLLRELNKAYAGFRPLSGSIGPAVAVATGNWGCGAFRGDPHLKALLQIASCAAAGRDIAYFTFHDSDFKHRLSDLHDFLTRRSVTAGALVQCLCLYGVQRKELASKDLFKFVYESFSSSGPASPARTTLETDAGVSAYSSAEPSTSTSLQDGSTSASNNAQGGQKTNASNLQNNMKITDFFKNSDMTNT
ncbi:poly(ADP-ribose) glycohydrolase [Hyalella azteca]|uniref:poly(ADP-ribose) glycohydrolase n=1 Tax=Hyalella azteca TaxID=294128 RepID=A0A8B7NAP3_HYAAZ|nr:poly(ADP-ribose) glycohydrolase [Hyalella azteca]